MHYLFVYINTCLTLGGILNDMNINSLFRAGWRGAVRLQLIDLLTLVSELLTCCYFVFDSLYMGASLYKLIYICIFHCSIHIDIYNIYITEHI